MIGAIVALGLGMWCCSHFYGGTPSVVWLLLCVLSMELDLCVFPRVGIGDRASGRQPYRHVKIVSSRRVSKARSFSNIPNSTTPGRIARNELDTHADTACMGSNWHPIDFTGEECEVAPFHGDYSALQNIPVGKCCSVWTSPDTGEEFLLVIDQALWFGSSLEHSLVNPNQIRDFGIPVWDDPYTTGKFGIELDSFDLPFDSVGTIVFFESRCPTAEERNTLPIILLTGDHWDPSMVDMRCPRNLTSSRNDIALRDIRSLTSGMSRDQIREVSKASSISQKVNPRGQVEDHMSKISGTFDEKNFVHRLVSQVHVASHNVESADDLQDHLRLAAVTAGTRHSDVTPEELARKWNISLRQAQATLEVTTHDGIRTGTDLPARRLRVDHLGVERPRLAGTWFCDTLQAKTQSIQGNKYANLFTNGKFTAIYPVAKKDDAHESLKTFIDEHGVPDVLISDLGGEFEGKKTLFQRYVRRYRIRHFMSEKGRKNQNHAAEREIGVLTRRWRSRMRKMKVPKRLWDYGLIYESELLSRTSRGTTGRTGFEEVTGDTPNIAEWLDFSFYDLVWYLDRDGKPDLTDDDWKLARWIGISHRVGSRMCYWLITQSGKLISKTSVRHVTRTDYQEAEVKRRIDEFNTKFEERMDDTNFTVKDDPFSREWWDDSADSVDQMDSNYGVVRNDENIPTDEEYGDMFMEDRPDDDEEEELIDKYLNMELRLDVGSGDERTGRVIKRSRGHDGNPIGRAHANPLFDTREYLVEMDDGTIERYTANVIAENMFAQVDDEGNQRMLIDEIVDHKIDNSAVDPSNGTYTTPSGNVRKKKTTRGHKLLVRCKDGSEFWEDLVVLKDTMPIEVAEYAVNNRIADLPAYAWWVPHVLKKRNRIISKVKKRYWRTTHKFGIRLPKNAEEALEIDRETGTDFWEKAIKKEMSKVKNKAWQRKHGVTPDDVRNGRVKDMVGFQEIKCHMIFDVKMDFTRKARFVAGGHTTDAAPGITYSSVVSRDSVRLGFMLAALNGVDIMACDLENAYLNAPCKEKIWFEGGVECGEDQGYVLVIVRALYGLRSSGNSWRAALAEVLKQQGFESTLADPDVWIRRAVRPDGFKYYEMLFVYVDDILAVSHKPLDVIKEITGVYKAKEGSVKEPDLYLGATIEKVQLKDGRVVWGSSARDYVKNAIQIVERLFDEDGEGYTLKSKVKNVFPTGYKPELDVTAELNDVLASRYLQLIGILRWAVELGRVDIFYEVSCLSQYQANPREGHLETIYHIFAYLKNHNNLGRIVYDPEKPGIDESAFESNKDWTAMYGEVEEEVPSNAPEPLGLSAVVSAFVDANHAGNVVTRRSHSGILIYVNNAPVIWYSKRQNTVEAATFGSELVALRICKEMIVALRYKLRMFGVPIEGPANVFCDNRGVVKNCSVPESVLAKKHNSINYHAVREAVAAGIIRVGKEDGDTNLADLFTKSLVGEKRWRLCHNILY